MAHANMRFISVIIFALALATGLAAAAGNGTDNKVADLMEAYLTFVKVASAKELTIPLRDVPAFPIFSIVPQVAIMLCAVNRTVSGMSNNSITGVSVVNNTAKYTWVWPDIKMQSDYQVGGLFYGRPITGQGQATLDLLNVTLDVTVTLRNVNVQWPLTNRTYLQIAELTEKYNVGSVATNLTGLTVTGMSQEDVTKLLDSQVITTLTLNLPIWEQLESDNIKSNMNLALVGSTIDDAINWLKKNTPEPSMFYSMMPFF